MLITSTFFILVFTGSVRNSELLDNFHSRDIWLESYSYNHPPLFEMTKDSSDPDEFEVRKIRAIKQINIQNENVSQIDGSPETSVIIQNPKSGKRLSLNSKIPVAVADDSETDLSTSNKKRKIEDSILRTKESTTTEKSLNTSPSPKTVVPKTFTKRPPEYNPVYKKIRQRDPVVKILEESNFVYSHKGNFHYSFEGADGTKVSSEGELKSFSDDRKGEAVSGNVFYTDKDGNDFSLSYTADEKGYRPEGAHLPTPPPIPPQIARALAYLATKPTQEPVTEKSKKKHRTDFY